MTPEETAWVAGFLEGEGCFALNDETTKWKDREYHYRYPRVSVSLTDLDVLERLQSITGVGTICRMERNTTPSHHKPCWAWSVRKKADAIDLMVTVAPLMGDRRRAKIASILAEVQKGGE